MADVEKYYGDYEDNRYFNPKNVDVKDVKIQDIDKLNGEYLKKEN